jgi:microcystin-dependent protein
MAQPYVGEIRIFAGNFAPAGWMFCQGQLLPISEYETLFNLIGTTYGGDGQSTFALPDLQSRVPIHMGNGFTLAETGGVETVTLTVNQIPAHSHTATSSTAGGTNAAPASSTILADQVVTGAPSGGTVFAYKPSGGTQVAMPAATVAATGGSQPHENVQPILVINYILSLFGIFPSQT